MSNDLTTANEDGSPAMHHAPNSSEYLNQARLAVEAAKQQLSRKAAIEENKQRNLRLKHLLHTEANSDGETLYELRVSVDKELRDELGMKVRAKRARMFIEIGSDECQTFKGLKSEIHAFYRDLENSLYLMSASLPEILEDGSNISPGDEQAQSEGQDPYTDFWPIDCDEDVVNTFEKAQEFFTCHNNELSQEAKNRLKRASILIHVSKDPSSPPPPPLPSYLEGIADPKDTETMTMLSFYSFPHGGVKDPEDFALFLRNVWKPFDPLGRVYIASEGINAQMSVPTNV